MHELVHELTEAITDTVTREVWLAPLMAFLAGLLSSITPCCLSAVPIAVGYVGGTSAGNIKKAFRLSLTFAGGTAITFMALGVAASILGGFAHEAGMLWYIFLGTLMLLMALQVWDVINIIPSVYLAPKNRKRGYIGALIAGMLGGVFSSPCAIPILAALLGITARIGNMLHGVLLLLLFSVGHSILVIAAGTSYTFLGKLTTSGKYGAFSRFVKIATGVLILLIGVYMFYNAFFPHID